ncbi:MAG: hypothetical protein HYU66_12730, partial [Armatimonadetes bacterium]|nr:hypothetical protein [Armatimonadota bacterium]
MRTHLLPALLLALFALPGTAEPLDPLMGDWQGTLTTAAGDKPIFAQVICWGREGYQANLLETLEQRVESLAVLRGPGDGQTVTFGTQAKIADGVFTGKLEGAQAGAFTLKHVVRLSPTLGEEPPADAEVLFGGAGFDQWRGDGRRAWIINLAQLVGGANRAAYLRCRLSVPAAVAAVLEVGSDDGVKAWLNGTLVHANPAFRPLNEWEDEVDIDLQAGENVLLLKVIQGQGDWSACARVRGRDGKDLGGLKVDPAPVLADGVDPAELYGESRGTILGWELAGPFMQEGKDAAAIAEQAFPPEQAGDTTTQWKVINDHPKPAPTWKLVDDAMEVTPGAGFMHSRQS